MNCRIDPLARILLGHTSVSATRGESCEPDLDIDYISKLSWGFVVADLENMVKQCIAKAAGGELGMATTKVSASHQHH